MAPTRATRSSPKVDRHPLTNAGKIALAEHKRAMAALAEQKKQAASDRPASKKARTLPPPDEMDADITATEKKERQKDLAASKKVSIRNDKWDFNKGKPMTNAQKIAAAKKASAKKTTNGGRKLGIKEKLKEAVGKKLGLRQEQAKKSEPPGNGRAEKKKSVFTAVMEQGGGPESESAFIGTGRTVGEESVVETIEKDETSNEGEFSEEDWFGEADELGEEHVLAAETDFGGQREIDEGIGEVDDAEYMMSGGLGEETEPDDVLGGQDRQWDNDSAIGED